MTEKFYKIGDVAELLGIEQHTLRYLESTLKLKIKRNERGDRLYNEDDLSTLQMVLKLKNEKGLNTTAIRMALDNLTISQPENSPIPLTPSLPPEIKFLSSITEKVMLQTDQILDKTEQIEERIRVLEEKLVAQDEKRAEKIDEIIQLWKNEQEDRGKSWINKLWKK